MPIDNDRYSKDMNYSANGVVPFREQDPSQMLYARELSYEEMGQSNPDFRGYSSIIFKRKWMIAAITLLGVMAAFVLTLRVEPLYKATTTIEIQREEVQIIEGFGVEPAVVADSEYMATQYQLLQSRTLAERVAEELNLPNDPRYSSPDAPRDIRLLQAASKIVGNLQIAPEGRSRIVKVQYVSPYPTETARISNALVEVFIQSNLERKFNTTVYAREFLDEQLATAKKLLEDSERQMVAYAESQGILDIETSSDRSASLDGNSILSLNNELSEAESRRIEAEQVYRSAIDSPSSRELLESDDLRRLRQRRSDLLADYQELLGKFKPDYPDMQKLQTRIDALDEEIGVETTAILSALRADFEAAVAREDSLRERVAELRTNLQVDRNRRIQYRILQREVDTNRSQYEALLQRSKEISIASGIGSSKISIVDEALVPGKPFEPNLRRTLLQAFVLSLGFGIALAFLIHQIDDTIKTPDDIRRKLGLPSIGVVPKVSKKTDLVGDALADPKSAISEALATAQTALEFATDEGAPRSLLVTSTRPGEGKTSTTIALATIFARAGKSVLIIDGDMRKPSFLVDSNKSVGLSGLLTGHQSLYENVIQASIPGLSVLPAGVIPPNPAQLLSGARITEIVEDAERLFDVVLIDSPPILSFADSPRLGSVVDAAIVVIQSGLIRTPSALRTMSHLYDSRTNIVGAVLTKFDAKRAGYEYSQYYSGYGRSAYAYVDSKKSKNSSRTVLIEAKKSDAEESEETKRWA